MKPGSIITTDGWRAYRKLGDYGYVHKFANHSINFVDPNTGANTNTMEGNWNGIKMNISPSLRTRKRRKAN